MTIGRATPHEIVITPSDNMGFIVTIGCARLVAADNNALLEKIGNYLKDPEHWERKYNEMRKMVRIPAPDSGTIERGIAQEGEEAARG